MVHPDCDYAQLFDHIEGAEKFRKTEPAHQLSAEGYKAFNDAVAVEVPARTLLQDGCAGTMAMV